MSRLFIEDSAMDEQTTEANLYMGNLTTLAGAIDMGAAAIEQVLGSEATATQVDGTTQTRREIQDYLITRLNATLGN